MIMIIGILIFFLSFFSAAVVRAHSTCDFIRQLSLIICFLLIIEICWLLTLFTATAVGWCLLLILFTVCACVPPSSVDAVGNVRFNRFSINFFLIHRKRAHSQRNRP